MRNTSKIKDSDAIIANGMAETPGYIISKDSGDFGMTERKGTQIYRIPAQTFLFLIG